MADIAASTARPVLAGEPDGSWRAYTTAWPTRTSRLHPLMLRAWRMAGVPTNIDSDTARVLAYIEACGKPVDTRDIALGLHISHASAESAVASLAATGLAAFIYRDGSFRIVPA